MKHFYVDKHPLIQYKMSIIRNKTSLGILLKKLRSLAREAYATRRWREGPAL